MKKIFSVIKIENTRIGIRLLFIFLMFALVIAITGIIAMQKMTTLASQNNSLYRFSHVHLIQLNNLKFEIYNKHNHLQSLLYTKDAYERDKLIRKIEKSDKLMNDILYELQQDTLFDKKNLNNLKQNIKHWNSISEEIKVLINLERNRQAVTLIQGRELQELKLILKRIKRMIDRSTNLGRQTHEQLPVVLSRSQLSFALTVVIMLIISIFISITITRTITRPIKNIIHSVKSIANENVENVLTIDRNDEIGQLGDAICNLQKKMLQKASEMKITDEKEAWINTGQNRLYEKIREYQSLNQLANNTLTFLCQYLQTPMGTLYIHYEKTKHLKLIASYSVSKTKKLPTYIRIGEGLIGQSVIDKELKQVNDVNEKFFYAKSASMEVWPSCITVLPFMYHQKVVGIIELGSFGELKDEKMQLLRRVADDIAIVFNTSIYRYKTMKLRKRTSN